MIAQAWSETCSLEHDEPKNRDIPGERMCTDDVVRETSPAMRETSPANDTETD